MENRTYGLGPFPVAIELTGQPGWVGGANPIYATIGHDVGGRTEAMLNFALVGEVYTDSCPASAPRAVSGVAGVADALASLTDFEVIEATPTTVDGYSGRYLLLEGPANADCDIYPLWRTQLSGTCRCLGQEPQRLGIWVIDVDGQAIVIDASTTPGGRDRPGTPQAVREQLNAMVTSIDINPHR